MREGDKTPLKERFEAASAAFATTFSRKARLHHAGERFYSASEFLEDLLKAARENELFPEALYSYFEALHGPHQIDGPRKRFGGYGPLRPRPAGGVGAMRIKRVLLWGVVASLLLATVVAVESYALLPYKYEAEVKVLVGETSPTLPTAPATRVIEAGLKEGSDGKIQLIPNAKSTGLQTFTQTVARAIPTTPIAQAVVRRLNLPRGSAEKVRENTSAQQDPGTMFVDITYRDSDPKRAQQVANAIGLVASQKASEMSLGENRISVTLWQPAALPAAPVSPSPLRNGLLAAFASLSLISAWAVLLSRPALTSHRSAARRT